MVRDIEARNPIKSSLVNAVRQRWWKTRRQCGSAGAQLAHQQTFSDKRETSVCFCLLTHREVFVAPKPSGVSWLSCISARQTRFGAQTDRGRYDETEPRPSSCSCWLRAETMQLRYISATRLPRCEAAALEK